MNKNTITDDRVILIQKQSEKAQLYLDQNYFKYISSQNQKKQGVFTALLLQNHQLEGIYKDYNDKTRILYSLLGYHYDEIDRIISRDISYSLILMLRLLEYNRYLALALSNWCSNFKEDNKDFINDIADGFLKELLTRLEVSKKDSEIYLLFRHYESMLTVHQRGIELIIERIVHLKSMKNSEELYDNAQKINYTDIEKLFDLAFSIMNINMYKLSYTVGELKKEPLVIDINKGLIIPDIDYIFENPEHAYFNYITDPVHRDKVSMFDDTKLNKEIKFYYGFTLDQMSLLIKKCKREHLTETFITDKKSFIDFIVHCTNFEKSDVMTFVEHLCFKLNKNEFYIEGASRTRKVSRRFLIELDGIYVFPYGLMLTAILNIIIDLTTGDTEYNNLSKLLNNHLKENNRKFEDEVFEVLKSLPNSIVKKNIHALKYSDGKSVFPNEIDMILLYNSKIFIIECKDIPLKTDFKKINNFESKLKGQYSRRLTENIKEVSNNKELLINYLEDTEKKYINSEVKGVFVLSSFFNTSLQNSIHAIVLFKDLRNAFIKNRI